MSRRKIGGIAFQDAQYTIYWYPGTNRPFRIIQTTMVMDKNPWLDKHQKTVAAYSDLTSIFCWLKDNVPYIEA